MFAAHCLLRVIEKLRHTGRDNLIGPEHYGRRFDAVLIREAPDA